VLGAPRVRLLWPPYEASSHAEEVFAATRQAMERLLPELGRLRLTVVLETHRRSIVPTASAARRLVDGFPPERFAVLFDPANGVTSGLEDPRFAVDVLGEYLAHVQFKNSGWVREEGRWDWTWMALEEGLVDWPSLLAHLRRRGWDDWLSNENFLLIPPDKRPARDEVSQAFASWHADLDLPLERRLAADREYLEQLAADA
jgi:sugar phosphate isomerase/epimerase